MNNFMYFVTVISNDYWATKGEIMSKLTQSDLDSINLCSLIRIISLYSIIFVPPNMTHYIIL